MKILQKTLAYLLSIGVVSACVLPAAHADSNSIGAISGVVYVDVDGDGKLSLGDKPLKDVTVSIYGSEEDALADAEPIATKSTGSAGEYLIKALDYQTYYVRAESEEYGVSQLETVSVSIQNPVAIANLQINANLSVDLETGVYKDYDADGNQGDADSLVDGKTVIFIDLAKTKQMIDDGSLGQIDVSSLVSNALSGNIDLGDAIKFRTSTNGEPITFPDVDRGAYIIMRSPFNLNVNEIVSDIDRISAFLAMIVSGDPQELLNLDPQMLSTGDITTTPTNEYLHKLADGLADALDAIADIDIEGIFGSEINDIASQVLPVFNAAAVLLRSIPATHFAVVDGWGNAWSLTDVNVKKTNQFYFGIEASPAIYGTIFQDLDYDGSRGSLDTGAQAKVEVFDADGQLLGSAATKNLVGTYRIENLPKDTDLYLALSGTNSLSYPAGIGTVPDALAGKRIIGTYNIESTAGDFEVKQNIGLADPSAIKGEVSGNTDGSAQAKFSNTNVVSASVEYQVDGGTAGQLTVPNGYLVVPGTNTADFTGLSEGDHQLDFTATIGVYRLPAVNVQFNIGAPPATPTVNIGGTVFYDLNHNGVQDSALELGLVADLTVYDADGNVLGTATSNSSAGQYLIEDLPFDEDLYLGFAGNNSPLYPNELEDIPAALDGKRIVGSYKIEAAAGQTTIEQNIGVDSLLALVKDVTGKVTDTNEDGSAKVTLTNSNLSDVEVTYRVDGGTLHQVTVAKRGLSGWSLKDGEKIFSLSSLSAGQHQLEYAVVDGVYKKPSKTIDFVIPAPPVVDPVPSEVNSSFSVSDSDIEVASSGDADKFHELAVSILGQNSEPVTGMTSAEVDCLLTVSADPSDNVSFGEFVETPAGSGIYVAKIWSEKAGEKTIDVLMNSQPLDVIPSASNIAKFIAAKPDATVSTFKLTINPDAKANGTDGHPILVSLKDSYGNPTVLPTDWEIGVELVSVGRSNVGTSSADAAPTFTPGDGGTTYSAVLTSSVPGTYEVSAYLKVGDDSNDLTPDGDTTVSFASVSSPLEIHRYAGVDRYQTSVLVNRDNLNPGGALFIATGADFPDALAVAPAVKQENGSLLLTGKKSLTPEGKTVVSDMNPSVVYVVGGNNAVSPAVVTQLKSLVSPGVKIIRVSGEDRYLTSLNIFNRFFANNSAYDSGSVFIATGTVPPDSLSAASVAGTMGSPVLLVRGSSEKNLPSNVVSSLKNRSVNNVYIAGGSQAVNVSLEKNLKAASFTVMRANGSDRFETNKLLNNYANQNSSATPVKVVWLATGLDFPDALSAAVYSGAEGHRLVLGRTDCLPEKSVVDLINKTDTTLERVNIMGGMNALSANIHKNACK